MRNYPEENPYPASSGPGDQPSVPGDRTSDDPDAIRAEIIHTRGEMSQTLNAIQERLDPERLKAEVRNEIDHVTEHVKEEVRDATIGRAEHFMNQIEDTAREAGDSVFDRLRAHPIPAALVGVGLAWLFLSGPSTPRRMMSGRYDEERYGYGRRTPYRTRGAYGYGYGRYPSGRYGEERFVGQGYNQGYGQSNESGVVDQVRGTVSNVADQVQNQAGQLGDQVQSQVQQVGQQVQQLGNQVQDTVSDMGNEVQNRVGDFSGDVQDEFTQLRWMAERSMRENPLAVGAVAVALGAAVGMIVPETHQEDELFGGARDQVVQRAESVAQDALQDVQQKVQQVADQAQNAVGSMQSGSSGQSGQSSGQRAAGQPNQPSQSTGQSGQHTSGQTTSSQGSQSSGQSTGTQPSQKPGGTGQQTPGQSGRQSAA